MLHTDSMPGRFLASAINQFGKKWSGIEFLCFIKVQGQGTYLLEQSITSKEIISLKTTEISYERSWWCTWWCSKWRPVWTRSQWRRWWAAKAVLKNVRRMKLSRWPKKGVLKYALRLLPLRSSRISKNSRLHFKK